MNLTNTESISRWYPASGLLEAANSITTNLNVRDANGNPLPGEEVNIKAVPNISSGSVFQTVTVTSDDAMVYASLPKAVGAATKQLPLSGFAPRNIWVVIKNEWLMDADA